MKVFILPLAALLAAVQSVTATACSGATFTTTAALEAALPTSCSSITGTLQLNLAAGEPQPHALPLVTTAGTVYIQPDMAIDMAAFLPNLETLTGTLNIRAGGDADLGPTVVSFPALTTAQVIDCEDENTVTEFSAPLLTTMSGKFNINRCHQVTTISVPKLEAIDWLTINDLGLLTNFDMGSDTASGFTCTKRFHISETELLTTLGNSFAGGLTIASPGWDIWITFTGLTTLANFHIVAAGELYFANNDALTAWDGTIATGALNGIDVSENDNLADLSGLYNALPATMSKGIEFSQMPLLTTFGTMFDNVVSCQFVALVDLGVTEVNFPVLEEITQASTGFDIRNCDEITAITAPNLHTVAGDIDININSATEITTFDIGSAGTTPFTAQSIKLYYIDAPMLGSSFQQATLTYNFVLYGLDSLVASDLDGLNIVSVDYVRIYDCDALTSVDIEITTITGRLEIENNALLESIVINTPQDLSTLTSFKLSNNPALISLGFPSSSTLFTSAASTISGNTALCCADVQAVVTGHGTSGCLDGACQCAADRVGPFCELCPCPGGSCDGVGTKTGSTSCVCVESAGVDFSDDCSAATIVEDAVTLESLSLDGGVQLVAYTDASLPATCTAGAIAYSRSCQKLFVCTGDDWVELQDEAV